MFTSPLFLAIAVFLGVAALVGGFALFVRDRSDSKVEDRLQMLTGAAGPGAGRETDAPSSLLAHPLDDQRSMLDALFQRFGNLDRVFEQADTSLTVGKFVLISAALAMVAMAAGVAFRLGPIVTPGLGLLMAVLPILWVVWRRKRRMRAFDSQLPDAMEMLARSLRSGQSLGFGFNMVSSEMPNPISKEFGRVFEEQNLGVPLEDTLHDLTDRVPSLDLKFFATAVVLQRQTGGDLAEILDKIGSLIRERFRIWGQVQALTGEGRLSGVVLMALPVVLFLAVWRLNPDYVMVLFTDPMGKKMLMYAVLLQILGALVIRKIVNIKV